VPSAVLHREREGARVGAPLQAVHPDMAGRGSRRTLWCALRSTPDELSIGGVEGIASTADNDWVCPGDFERTHARTHTRARAITRCHVDIALGRACVCVCCDSRMVHCVFKSPAQPGTAWMIPYEVRPELLPGCPARRHRSGRACCNAGSVVHSGGAAAPRQGGGG
jgi:hypothetical protein